jgi:hypothetical protein
MAEVFSPGLPVKAAAVPASSNRRSSTDIDPRFRLIRRRSLPGRRVWQHPGRVRTAA